MSATTTIVIASLLAYVILVQVLKHTKVLERFNMDLMLGFILMFRTKKGLGIIDKLSTPKKAWNRFGDIAIGTVLIMMVTMFIMVIYGLIITMQNADKVHAFGAKEVLIIPGVTPFLPLGYGIVALLVTLVIHEGAHGILTRSNNVKLKNLGVLGLGPLPIGAFVEHDEEELMKTSRRKRMRIVAAGPFINFVVALLLIPLFIGLVSLGTPHTGAYIDTIGVDSPAHDAGLLPSSIITMVGPHEITTQESFVKALSKYDPGDQVTIITQTDKHTVTLASAWSQLTPEQKQAYQNDRTQLQNQAYLGVTTIDPHAFHNAFTDLTSGRTWATMLYLPLGDIFGTPILNTYLPDMHDMPGHDGAYWMVALTIFWIAWINLMVGLTNALPMFPLDGGHMCRDSISWLLQKIRPSMHLNQALKHATSGTALASVVLLLVVVATYVIPNIVQG